MAKNGVLDSISKLVYVWEDRKRYLGMPISFTKYKLSEDRLFMEVGLLNTKCDEILLYKVRDVSVSRTLGQKLFGVGSVAVESTDKSMPVCILKNIKYSIKVKELIHKMVEEAKINRGIRFSELVGTEDYDNDEDVIRNRYDY